MTVLVTGASGFVGRAIVDDLVTRGIAVRAASRKPSLGARVSLPEHVTMPDLAGTIDWTPLLQGVDAVVHAAGLAHQSPGTGEAEVTRVNATASADLAGAAAAAGIARFILVSSIRAISGPSAEAILKPDTPPLPIDAYGRSKLAAEQAVAAALPGAFILRSPVVHGAGAKANMARLARLAASPWPLPIGGLQGRRSIVSDRNLASAVAHLLAAGPAAPRVVHVHDGEPLDVAQMIAAMRRALGRRAGVMTPPLALDRRLVQLMSARLDAQLAQDLVVTDDALRASGWQPPETSQQGLARMVRAAHTRL